MRGQPFRAGYQMPRTPHKYSPADNPLTTTLNYAACCDYKSVLSSNTLSDSMLPHRLELDVAETESRCDADSCWESAVGVGSRYPSSVQDDWERRPDASQCEQTAAAAASLDRRDGDLAGRWRPGGDVSRSDDAGRDVPRPLSIECWRGTCRDAGRELQADWPRNWSAVEQRRGGRGLWYWLLNSM